MIRRIFSFVFPIALALLSLSAHALELGDSPMALTGDNDLQVTIAPTADGSQALVKMTGFDHPLAGLVLLASVEERSDDERAYRAEVDGKMRSLVVYADSPWATSDYTAYIPGQQESHAMKLEEEQGSDMDLQALVAEYEQQKERGEQEKLARFDRDKAVHRQQRALEGIDRSASEVCGSEVTTRVDWDALDNEQLNRLSISGYCGQVTSEIGYMCRRDEGFRQKAKAISEVNCGFADTMDLRRDAGKLVFETREDARNQRDSIKDFLQTL